MDANNGNSAVTTAAEPATYKRHVLTAKQQEFFRLGRQSLQRLQDQMNGALQYICLEHDLRGQATLSEDCTELILEEK